MRQRLSFSRLRLIFLTVFNLGLVALSALGIQDGRLWLAAPSYALLVFSACLMLLLCREWFSPSYIEMAQDQIFLRWNNWRLEGQRLQAHLTPARPRRLILAIGQPALGLDPVGPLHLTAMLAVMPLLRLFLPPHLAKLYFLNSAELSKLLCPDGGPAVVSFPAWLFGRRRIGNVMEKSLG